MWAAKGTLVHRALELLYLEAPGDRTVEAGLAHLEAATPEILGSREYVDLSFTDEEMEAFRLDAQRLVRNTFRLEDPAKVRPIGLELRMQAHLGTLKLRGIIDRLELDEDGGLVVTDYKTGKVPGVNFEQSKLGGLHFYAFLVEQMLGRRPAKVQLLYLSEPVTIVGTPSEQSIRGLQIRASAIWKAVETACSRDDFRPKPSRLCNYCSFQQWCPAFGGDPTLAPSRKWLSDAELAAQRSTAGSAAPQVAAGTLTLEESTDDQQLDQFPIAEAAEAAEAAEVIGTAR